MMTARAAIAIGLALYAGSASADPVPLPPPDVACPGEWRLFQREGDKPTWLCVSTGRAATVDALRQERRSETCFRPEGPSCEAMLIRQIDSAKRQIRVSIYEWTLRSLRDALMRAKSRGVDVAVVVDKAAVRAPDAPAQAFSPHVNHAAGGLNHDKFAVIDGEVLCTGSFNFTWSAEHSNAENAICLRGADVAAQYLQHWEANSK